MTPTQTQAAKAKLSVDLAGVDAERLIELCLLHRANPEAHTDFPGALKAELERRFTPDEIGRDDTLFSVLTHFSNQFQTPIPMMALRLREMAATVNRDIWFTDNRALFISALNDAQVMAWVVKEHDILEKILNNQIALPLVAQSETASTAILTDNDALALWKSARNLWQTWANHTAGMAVLAKSAELTQYAIDTAWGAVAASSTAMNAVAASSTAMNAVIASSTAMNAVIASSTAMNAVAASSTAMNAVIASSTAMNAVIASSTAMNAVAAQEPALRAIVNSESARNALMANNDKLQAVREAMYSTVKNVWTKVRTVDLTEPGGNIKYVANNNQIKTAPANTFVFVDITSYYQRVDSSNGRLEHPNGQTAATGGGEPKKTAIVDVDGVSFGGAQVQQTVHYIAGAAEIFAPS